MSPRRRCVRHVPIKLGKNVFLYALFTYKLTEFRQNRPFFGPFSEYDASKRPLRGNFLISGAYKSGKTRRFIGPILKITCPILKKSAFASAHTCVPGSSSPRNAVRGKLRRGSAIICKTHTVNFTNLLHCKHCQSP